LCTAKAVVEVKKLKKLNTLGFENSYELDEGFIGGKFRIC
jgi:hypothetical protein